MYFKYLILLLSILLVSISLVLCDNTNETQCQRCMKNNTECISATTSLKPCRYILNSQGIQTACCCKSEYLCEDIVRPGYDPNTQCNCLRPKAPEFKDKSRSGGSSSGKISNTTSETKNTKSNVWKYILIILIIAGAAGAAYYFLVIRKRQKYNDNNYSNTSPKPYVPTAYPINQQPNNIPVAVATNASVPVNGVPPGNVQYVQQPYYNEPPRNNGGGAMTGALLGGAAGLATGAIGGALMANALNHGGSHATEHHHYYHNESNNGGGYDNNNNNGAGNDFDQYQPYENYDVVGGEF